MFCRHNWEKTSKVVLPSPFEQIGSLRGFGREFFREKLIVILKCTLCGKLDKTVEVNP